jgi:hypothetical protein
VCFNDNKSDQETCINYKIHFFKYLANGCSFHDPYFSFRTGISTASKRVTEVCRSIWSIMRPECIPTPTTEQWELTALELERRANFLHCI